MDTGGWPPGQRGCAVQLPPQLRLGRNYSGEARRLARCQHSATGPLHLASSVALQGTDQFNSAEGWVHELQEGLLDDALPPSPREQLCERRLVGCGGHDRLASQHEVAAPGDYGEEALVCPEVGVARQACPNPSDGPSDSEREQDSCLGLSFGATHVVWSGMCHTELPQSHRGMRWWRGGA